MDKTQTPPGRDGGSEDAGKKEYYGKPVKAKDVADDAEKELNKAMDNAHKNKARKMYELADRLSKVDTSKLNEQQLVEHTGMIKRLGEELKAMRGMGEGATMPKDDPRYNLDRLDPRRMGDTLKNRIKQRTGKDVYGKGRAAAGMPAIHDYANKPHLPEGDVAEARTMRDTGNDIDDTVEDYLDYLQELNGGFDHPTREEEKASIMADIESGALDPEELEYAMSGMEEAAGDLHTNYNVVKLGGALNVDPRGLRMAIARGMQGNPTRTDMMTLSNAFLNLLKNSDDMAIQQFANLVKSGNPRAAGGREVPQESTAAIAERNAFVDAMRQVKKGEKFTVGGKEFTKTTSHGESKVDEAINTEAYDRLKKVFDFSDYKG